MKFDLAFGRAAFSEILMLVLGWLPCEASSVTWTLAAYCEYPLGVRKATENLYRLGRSQDLPGAN
jgi:hypothetical protein